jgi:histidinol-phosphate aminotransferase
MTSDFRFNLKEFKNFWTEKHKLIFLTNPNNPTGTYFSKSEFEEFLDFFADKPTLIIMDEAYFEFVRAKDYPNSMEMIKKYKNLVNLRTMSKVYGLAGLRLGIMTAQPEVVDLINRVRKPFNINSLMQVGAIAALDDVEFIKKTQKLTWDGLDYFYKELEKMGLSYIPSQGNFVLFDVKQKSTDVYEKLLAKGVILRPVKNYGFETYLRMSVGLPHENEKAVAALKEIVNNRS